MVLSECMVMTQAGYAGLAATLVQGFQCNRKGIEEIKVSSGACTH